MSVVRFRRALEERLIERANGIAEQLCAGKVETMDKYSSLTGQIRAFREVEEWLDDLERKAVGYEDEQK